MTIHRQLHLVCVAGFAVMLAACSGQPESPTAPSALNSAAPASVPGSSTTAAHTEGVTIASAPAPSQSTTNFEIKFMTDMIDHHHMAVMMAAMCIAKAIHPEFRSLCENIRTAQMAEIEEMQASLQDWYGITYEPVMTPGDEMMMQRLASLSGAEFEIAFTEMMLLELLQPSDQSLHLRRRRVIDQCAADYRNRAKSTMSSKLITRHFSRQINDLAKSN